MENQNNHNDERLRNVQGLMNIIDEMWNGLIRFFYILILFVSICASYYYIQARRAYVPRYETYVSFVVNTHTAAGYNESYYNKTTATQLGRTFPYIMTSGALNRVVAEDMGMSSVPGTIKAEVLADTALFTIRVQAAKPQLSYDILQSVIRNYPVVAEYIIGDTQLNILDESGIPTKPVNPPNFQARALRGAEIGMLICFLFLYGYAVTRRTVRREEDLKERLSIPFLGAVPRVFLKKRSKEENSLVLLDHKEIAASLGEALKTVRNRFVRDTEENGIKTVVVTSATEGEGKSTIAANLAISLSRKRKKTVLVDCDMRNPSVTSVLGLQKAQHGTADVLRGTVAWKEVLMTYGKAHLKVIPGAGVDQKPIELLGSEAFDKLLRELEEEFDYVIIDAPPCGILSDASAIARHSQGCVFVVRQNTARIQQVVDCVSLMDETGVRMLGYVLNAAQVGITGYGYGYGYGYGAYSRYGYGFGKYGYGILNYGYGRYGSNNYNYGQYGKYGYGRYGYGYGYGHTGKEEEPEETVEEAESSGFSNESILEEAKAEGFAEMKPEGFAEVKPENPEDVKPEDSVEDKAEGPEEVKTEDAEEAKAEGSEEVKMEDSEEEKEEDSEEVKSEGSEEVKPEGAEEAKPEDGGSDQKQ